MSDIELHGTTDAATWAKEFCKNWPTALCQVEGREGVESEDDFEAIMTSWFANAIMAGVDSAARAKPKVKPLDWQNFDAWTYWAETPLATYRVNERGGYWRLSAQVGGEEICPDEMHGNSEVEAKSAAETYHQAMILGALE